MRWCLRQPALAPRSASNELETKSRRSLRAVVLLRRLLRRRYRRRRCRCHRRATARRTSRAVVGATPGGGRRTRQIERRVDVAARPQRLEQAPPLRLPDNESESENRAHYQTHKIDKCHKAADQFASNQARAIITANVSQLYRRRRRRLVTDAIVRSTAALATQQCDRRPEREF